MIEHLLVLLVCLAIIVVMAILIYAVSRGQLSVLSTICELRLNLQQILEEAKKIDRTLDIQRRILNDAHKQISTVTKGLQKPSR